VSSAELKLTEPRISQRFCSGPAEVSTITAYRSLSDLAATVRQVDRRWTAYSHGEPLGGWQGRRSIMSEHPPGRPADPEGGGQVPDEDGEPRPATAADAAIRAQAASEDDDLRRSLAALSQLATGRMQLGDALTRVAEFAVQAISGADGAGLTLLEEDRHDTIVASAGFVAQVDAIQYGIEEGPCITAAAEARTVRSGSLESDPQWPRFGPRVGRLGVHSVLSIPLLTSDAVLGAMNVYAHQRDAFDEHAVLVGELFAVPATIAVQNAQVLAQAKRLASQLQDALTSRATIDQALGIVMSRVGCGPEEAFDRLRQLSQGENRKLHTVAQELVDEAVRRARARHARS
jgi:Response regulator with putative antiterminator output domain